MLIQRVNIWCLKVWSGDNQRWWTGNDEENNGDVHGCCKGVGPMVDVGSRNFASQSPK